MDTDNRIDLDDINAAKDHIVQNLKKQEFESKFNKIASVKAIDVIRRMAQANMETANMSFLSYGLHHLSEGNIGGILGELEEKGIIEKQHRGSYKFAEPLFKIYVRWLFGIGAH